MLPAVAHRRQAHQMATATTSGHYGRHTADSYESAYFYSRGEYTDWLKGEVISALAGSSENSNASTGKRRLIDIGGGTGNFTRMILDGVPNMEAVVVDPFLEASSDFNHDNSDGTGIDNGEIQFVKAGAEDYAEITQAGTGTSTSNNETWWKRDYDQVLMKEVVHHLDASDRTNVFRGLRKGLRSRSDADTGPSVVIVTRPQLDIDYPLWSAARKVWAENQPSASDIKTDLSAAGFEEVESTIKMYPAQIQLDRWLAMVRDRFWSTFSNFSDDELEDACRLIEMEAKTDAGGIVHFEDRLVFISAK